MRWNATPFAAIALTMAAFGATLMGASTEPIEADVPPRRVLAAPTFSEPRLIDEVRSGGEPVIAVGHDGAIFIGAHPGYSLAHRPGVDLEDPLATPTDLGVHELVVPSRGQSYLWRSQDDGRTWHHIGLAPLEAPNNGPAGPALGVSDPDLTVDGLGRIWMTDLALATASARWSDDGGDTWHGDNRASQNDPGRTVDRPWLASHNDSVYYVVHELGVGVQVLRRGPGDEAFHQQATLPANCRSDMLANPQDGHLYTWCRDAFAVGTRDGTAWSLRDHPVAGGGPLLKGEPAVDAAGQVYLAGARNDAQLEYGHSSDEGLTWGHRVVDLDALSDDALGTIYHPWVVAGDKGRIAIVFHASDQANAAARGSDAAWNVYALFVADADTEAPAMSLARLTPQPFHVGSYCTGGFLDCQNPSPQNQGEPIRDRDRRLGDIFEATLDAQGYLHVAYTDTSTHPDHTIGHPAYVRQVGGFRLIEAGPAPGFPTQG